MTSGDINDFIAAKSSEKKQEVQADKDTEKNVQENKFVQMMRERKAMASADAAATLEEIWDKNEQWRNLLFIMERFSRGYGSKGEGPTNALLIARYAPHATYLKSFVEWSNAGGKIRKGEKSMRVLVKAKTIKSESTYVNVEDVFDISQVDGIRDLPMPNVGLLNSAKTCISQIAAAKDVRFEFSTELPDGYDSVYIPTKDVVFLREGIGIERTAICILAELCHRDLAKHARSYTRIPENEFAAWSAAVMLGNRLGLDTSSISFNAIGWPDKIKTYGEKKEMLSWIYHIFLRVVQYLDKCMSLHNGMVIYPAKDLEPVEVDGQREGEDKPDETE